MLVKLKGLKLNYLQKHKKESNADFKSNTSTQTARGAGS